jgi:hypothetical protein
MSKCWIDTLMANFLFVEGVNGALATNNVVVLVVLY